MLSSISLYLGPMPLSLSRSFSTCPAMLLPPRCRRSALLLPAREAYGRARLMRRQVLLETDRQARVILGQPGRPGRARRAPAQRGQLQLGVERVTRAMQHGRHPPGEVLAAPDPPQGGVG